MSDSVVVTPPDMSPEMSEDQLVDRARSALSQCNWVIGECAVAWTEKYSRGRTDADFGSMIGLSGDQVYQRRRVWETFSDVHEGYPGLKWSHFYVALNWDDAAECLGWANEMEATIAEMKAWRRARHGEDLTTPADEEPIDPSGFLSATPAFVKQVGDSRTTLRPPSRTAFQVITHQDKLIMRKQSPVPRERRPVLVRKRLPTHHLEPGRSKLPNEVTAPSVMNQPPNRSSNGRLPRWSVWSRR